MDKEEEILSEVRESRRVLAYIVGTSDLPPEEQFSKEALDKAALDYKKLEKQRGEWVSGNDLYKILKKCHYGTGKFIREEFKFSNYFKEGSAYFYNKKSLQALADDLKKRNIKLSRYMELKEEKEKFNKKIESALYNKKSSKGKRAYYIAPNLRDVNTSDSPKPPIKIIKEDIKGLREQFLKEKLDDYIDIYDGSFAMLKFEYSTKKYFSPEVKKRSAKWVEDFNYANKALDLLNGAIEPFKPTRDEDMIQL
jgi:hypothetical protein